MVNKVNMLKWVEALESGAYRQGRGQNYCRNFATGDDEYCCLGVACLVAEQDDVSIGQNWRQGGVLEREVRDWLGVAQLDPVVGSERKVNGGCGCGDCKYSSQLTATRANDNAHMTFAEIAQSIREHYNLGPRVVEDAPAEA